MTNTAETDNRPSLGPSPQSPVVCHISDDFGTESHDETHHLTTPANGHRWSCDDDQNLDNLHDVGANNVKDDQISKSDQPLHSDRPQQDDQPQKAPDGGYGWFVVLGCFISHVVMGGVDRSEGIFFLLFLDRFGQSAQLAAWPGAVATTLQMVLGPVAHALTARYSARTSVIIGGALMALGFTLSGVATNFPVLVLSHAIIDGVGRGLVYAPGLILVGAYFDKRAGVAVGLSTSGVGIGTFLIVPSVQWMSEEFGYQGTFLIIGAFTCNMVLAGMLYRPLSMHRKFTRRSHARGSSHRRDDVSTEEAGIMLEERSRTSEERIPRAFQTVGSENGSLNGAHKSHNLNAQGIFESDVQHVKTFYASGSQTSDLHRQTPTASTRFKKAKRDNCLKSSLKIIFPVEDRSRETKKPTKLCYFYLLKSPSFLMYCLNVFCFAMAFRTAFTFIPALVKSKGMSDSQAALALSIAGAVDTVGRIGAGLLLDIPKLRPFRLALYNLFIFGVALAAFVLPSLSDFASLGLTCGMYGLLTGAYISQKSVVLLDVLDPQHMASSFGIFLGFQGLGSLLGPPLAGALKDNFGTYDEAFYLGGGMLVVAGLIMVLCNMFVWARKKREKAARSLE